MRLLGNRKTKKRKIVRIVEWSYDRVVFLFRVTGEGDWFSSTRLNNWVGPLVSLVIVLVAGLICILPFVLIAKVFEFCFWAVFGKDLHWAVDLVLGCLAIEFLPLVFFVCLLLWLGGAVPLMGG